MRKEIKKHALNRLKKCYWMMVVLCLSMAVVSIDYVSSLRIIQTDTDKGVAPSIQSQIFDDIIQGHETLSNRRIRNYIEQQRETSSNLGIIAISHSRGVFAQLVNGVSSGQMYQTIYNGLKTMTNSKTASIVFFVFLSLLFVILVKVIFVAAFEVTARRIALEFGNYDKVPLRRFMYLLSVRRMWNVAKTMFLTGLYLFLWSLTIVGFFIKSYSYRQVTYILAENPTIPSKTAITLSRKMMDGHKWEAFVLELSFIGWRILEFLSFGISGILFSNPYRELTMAEYYRHLRSAAKENQIPDIGLLNDIYLFEKADTNLLRETYSDLQDAISEADTPIAKHTGIRGFFENVFGVILFYDKDEAAFQQKKSIQLAVSSYKDICEQNMYPFRLFPAQYKRPINKLTLVQYDRHYSLFSLIFMFFTMSFIGWCWEVSLHLISDGTFTNRGFTHGPWLPIYGFGGVLILVMLYRFRRNIFLEFLSAVVLCGIVEYYTAWYMELTHNGTKWWDYSGYFLNIDGRVCAEGLLVFGLGGLAIVYLLAPFLDNVFRRISKKLSIMIAAILLIVFNADVVYSQIHPNTGKGITSAADLPEETEADTASNTQGVSGDSAVDTEKETE